MTQSKTTYDLYKDEIKNISEKEIYSCKDISYDQKKKLACLLLKRGILPNSFELPNHLKIFLADYIEEPYSSQKKDYFLTELVFTLVFEYKDIINESLDEALKFEGLKYE